jgi:hypothetical protein
MFGNGGTILSPIPVLANETQQATEPSNMACTVTAIIPDPTSYTVTIPKTLELNPETNSVEYDVKVEGVLADPTYYVKVQPDSSFQLTSDNKEPVAATVTQDRTIWGSTEVNGAIVANGTITAETELTMGEWTGSFNFNIILEQTLEPGVYAADGTMIASWEELESFGFDINADINTEEYEGVGLPSTMFFVVMQQHPELANTTKIVLPSDATKIGDYALAMCGANEVVIPNTVESIGVAAFYSCEKLERLVIPESVINIGYGAFGGTPWLANEISNSLDGTVFVNNILVDGSAANGSIVLPETVVDISAYCFFSNTNLTGIHIPSGVKAVKENTFENCYNLGVVTFAENSQLECIEKYAFSACDIAEITIPKGVKRIEEMAFQVCPLTSVVFEEGSQLEFIDTEAFRLCENLTSIMWNGITYTNIDEFYEAVNNQ